MVNCKCLLVSCGSFSNMVALDLTLKSNEIIKYLQQNH